MAKDKRGETEQEVAAIAAMLAFASSRTAEIGCSRAKFLIDAALSEIVRFNDVDLGVRAALRSAGYEMADRDVPN